MGVAPFGASFQIGGSRYHLNANSRTRIARGAWVALQCWLLCCGEGGIARAAQGAPFAAPSQQPALPGSAGGLLRVTLALIVVLGVVLAAAWLARRARAGRGADSASLEILAQLPLGARERAVLIRVGERQLLIGVAAGNVRTLHVLEPRSAPPAAATGAATDTAPASTPGMTPVADGNAPRPTFKALLLRSLGK